METGELVPTIVVLHLLTEAMVAILNICILMNNNQVEKIYGGKAKGFLLDAFPCNLDQVLRRFFNPKSGRWFGQPVIISYSGLLEAHEINVQCQWMTGLVVLQSDGHSWKK